jgi:hypothetical protein
MQLNAFHAYFRVKNIKPGMDIKQWCLEAFLDPKTMEEIWEVRIQLLDIVQGLIANVTVAAYDDEYEEKISKALARGLFHNVASSLEFLSVMLSTIGISVIRECEQLKPDRIPVAIRNAMREEPEIYIL